MGVSVFVLIHMYTDKIWKLMMPASQIKEERLDS